MRKWLATAGGLGYSPFAPGTVGTLAGVVAYLLCSMLAEPLQSAALAALFAVVCVLGVILGDKAEEDFGRKDPRQFVLDEVAGFLLAVLIYRQGHVWQIALWNFLAARALDVIKPPPASNLEKLPGGWGIMADDLVSSAYAGISLHVCRLALDWAGYGKFFCS